MKKEEILKSLVEAEARVNSQDDSEIEEKDLELLAMNKDILPPGRRWDEVRIINDILYLDLEREILPPPPSKEYIIRAEFNRISDNNISVIQVFRVEGKDINLYESIKIRPEYDRQKYEDDFYNKIKELAEKFNIDESQINIRK